MGGKKKNSKQNDTTSSTSSDKITAKSLATWPCKEAEEVHLEPLSLDPNSNGLNNMLFQCYLKESLVGKRVAIDFVIELPLFGTQESFKCVYAGTQDKDISEEEKLGEQLEGIDLESPGNAYLIKKTTRITITAHAKSKSASSDQEKSQQSIPEAPIAGLFEQRKMIEEYLQIAFEERQLYSAIGVKAMKGVIFQGPSGSGKTMLVNHIKYHHQHYKFYNFQEYLLQSRFVGETEQSITKLFEEIKNTEESSVIIIEELDQICKTNPDGQNSLMATLVGQIDELTDDARVLIIGCTNKPAVVDAMVKRSGRLDAEIAFDAPNDQERYEIFNLHLEKLQQDFVEEDIHHLVKNSQGFFGSDIATVCRKAGIYAAARYKEQGRFNEENLSELKLSLQDMDRALLESHPANLRELSVEVPKVNWSDIGGNVDTKNKLKQAVEWPVKHPEAFKRMGIQPPKGVLLYGPPGCSKTMMAKAIATEGKMNFIAVKGPELYSKFVGDTEKSLRDIFRRARISSPCVIFFDEIESLASERKMEGKSEVGVGERVLCTLLNELDGIESLEKVIVIGATNRPDLMDKALLRPGRFDRMLYLGLPEQDDRREILRINTEKAGMPMDEDVDLDKLAGELKGYTGAEIAQVCREAGMCALTESLDSGAVKLDHFLQAITMVDPQITSEVLGFYENYNNQRKNMFARVFSK